MKCPKCTRAIKSVAVAVQGAASKVTSYQCTSCDYFEFEPLSSRKVVEELQQTPLKLKQKIVKLSQDRLGVYFNRHVVQSLGLKSGEEVLVSVPDKKHIVLEIS